MAVAHLWQAEELPNGRVIRILRAKPKAAGIVELLSHARLRGLDPVLAPTDRLLERWAVTQGSDEYLVAYYEVPQRSRPPPLDDDTSIVVDRIVMRQPYQTREFTKRWYFRPGEPISGLARALGLHRDTVTMRWNSVLWALRREFLDVPLDV
jgi:hypothetical protein